MLSTPPPVCQLTLQINLLHSLVKKKNKIVGEYKVSIKLNINDLYGEPISISDRILMMILLLFLRDPA